MLKKETRTHVIDFIKVLDREQREKLAVMLEKGIVCGEGIAKTYHIDPLEFNAELNDILVTV